MRCGKQVRFHVILNGKHIYLCRIHYNELPDLSPDDEVINMADGETMGCDHEV